MKANPAKMEMLSSWEKTEADQVILNKMGDRLKNFLPSRY